MPPPPSAAGTAALECLLFERSAGELVSIASKLMSPQGPLSEDHVMQVSATVGKLFICCPTPLHPDCSIATPSGFEQFQETKTRKQTSTGTDEMTRPLGALVRTFKHCRSSRARPFLLSSRLAALP